MTMINKVANTDTTSRYTVNPSKTNSEDFSSYLGESKNLDRIFDQAADKYNIPVELLKSVGKAESNFNANAVSRCGAQGIMQLMPSTAKGLGVKDSFDPEQNIMGGAKYLSALLNKYDGNTKLALAAYNAGSGNVDKYGGIPPFEETQNYVKKIVGFMKQNGADTSGSFVGSDNTDDISAAVKNADNTPNHYLHVAPATLPVQSADNYAYLLNGSTADQSVTDLESVFSYDDYMKFIDLFLKDENDQNSSEDSKNFAAKDISYNAAVLNLLTTPNNTES